MLRNIETILHERCKIRANEVLLVGFSGGPDSLCLLHILHQLGFPLVAIHVDHGLRLQAEEDSRQAQQVCQKLNIEYVGNKADVLDFAEENSLSIEEAARVLRYRIVFDEAKKYRAQAVAVGHNADDQVETILMHLLRGTGLAGLRGMEFRALPNPWSDSIPLVRPLLSNRRTEINAYLAEHSLAPIIDQSNTDKTFFRNRIRHELLPMLESYNPSVRKALTRLGQMLKDDYAFLQASADQAWNDTFHEQGQGYLSFNTQHFLRLPLAIQRLVLRKAIEYHRPGLSDVGFDCVERAITSLAGENPRMQTDLIGGMRLEKGGRFFWIATNWADLPAGDFPAVPNGQVLSLETSSCVELLDGWRIVSEVTDDVNLSGIQATMQANSYQAWLDADTLQLPLIVHSRKPGESIKPLGLGGHSIKISDVMTNIKIPQRARKSWPMVYSGEEIIWMPGYRISERVRILASTKTVLHLQLSQVLSP